MMMMTRRMRCYSWIGVVPVVVVVVVVVICRHCRHGCRCRHDDHVDVDDNV